MNTHKVAISVPMEVLQAVDRWAGKLNQSRSRFIAEQMEKRLQELEDEEVTQLYDQAYQEEKALAENRELAEGILRLAPRAEEEEEW